MAPVRTPEHNLTSASAIVVNWNGGKAFQSCLASLRNQTRPPGEIIVVDNGSTDDSLDAATREFKGLRVLRNQSNLGYGAGVNQGAALATGEWLALLNNDAVADPEWLEQLLNVAAAPGVGAVACKIYLDRKQGILDKVGHKLAIDGQNFGRGHGCIDSGQYDHLTEVAWPDGCAGLWRRSTFLDVGGMDEEFFAYADDADLGIRFRLAGWRCALAPGAVAEHRHSQTLGAYSARKLFLVERNRIWLAMKYFPLPLLMLNPLFWVVRAALTMRASRQQKGLWANVAESDRSLVRKAVLRAQLAGWLGARHQLAKRAQLDGSQYKGWQRRFRHLLRSERARLSELAVGIVP